MFQSNKLFAAIFGSVYLSTLAYLSYNGKGMGIFLYLNIVMAAYAYLFLRKQGKQHLYWWFTLSGIVTSLLIVLLLSLEWLR